VHQVEVIVMLTTLVEGGRVKSSQYWPEPGQRSEIFGDHEVMLKSEQEFDHYIVRELMLGEREIVHIQVKGWGDYSVPETTTTLLSLLEKVKDVSSSRKKKHSEPSPILVHCSAGVGRTGTFIATFRMLSSFESSSLFSRSRASVWDTVLDMRKARPRMVQKREQYLYIYQCIRDHLLQGGYS